MEPDKPNDGSRKVKGRNPSLSYIFSFLAKECGWTLDYILDNLTIQQIQMYYENIQLVKIDQLKTLAGVVGNAVAYGSGNLKAKDFTDYLKALDPRSHVTKDQLKEAKEKGLPIEEI